MFSFHSCFKFVTDFFQSPINLYPIYHLFIARSFLSKIFHSPMAPVSSLFVYLFVCFTDNFDKYVYQDSLTTLSLILLLIHFVVLCIYSFSYSFFRSFRFLIYSLIHLSNPPSTHMSFLSSIHLSIHPIHSPVLFLSEWRIELFFEFFETIHSVTHSHFWIFISQHQGSGCWKLLFSLSL